MNITQTISQKIDYKAGFITTRNYKLNLFNNYQLFAIDDVQLKR